MTEQHRLASDVLQEAATLLEPLVARTAEDGPQRAQGAALVVLLRAEADAAKLTEAMFAAPGDAARSPVLVALLEQTYPPNVRAAVAYALTLTGIWTAPGPDTATT